MKFSSFIVPGGSQEPPAFAPGVAVRATMEAKMAISWKSKYENLSAKYERLSAEMAAIREEAARLKVLSERLQRRLFASRSQHETVSDTLIAVAEHLETLNKRGSASALRDAAKKVKTRWDLDEE